MEVYDLLPGILDQRKLHGLKIWTSCLMGVSENNKMSLSSGIRPQGTMGIDRRSVKADPLRVRVHFFGSPLRNAKYVFDSSEPHPGHGILWGPQPSSPRLVFKSSLQVGTRSTKLVISGNFPFFACETRARQGRRKSLPVLSPVSCFFFGSVPFSFRLP